MSVLIKRSLCDNFINDSLRYFIAATMASVSDQDLEDGSIVKEGHNWLIKVTDNVSVTVGAPTIDQANACATIQLKHVDAYIVINYWDTGCYWYQVNPHDPIDDVIEVLESIEYATRTKQIGAVFE